jgi:hypothetical protein
MIYLLFSPFYAATISIGSDGSLMLTSARERLLAWGIVFCIMAAVSLGLWLLRIARPWCLTGLLLALLIPSLVIPSLHRQHIHVLPDRITVGSGPWFMPATSVIDLSDLLHIREDEKQFRIAGYYVEPNAIWHVTRADGTRDQVLLNEFFTAHRMVVAQYLRDRGRIVRVN